MDEQALKKRLEELEIGGQSLTRWASVEEIQIDGDEVLVTLHFQSATPEERHDCEDVVKGDLRNAGFEDVTIETLADNMPQPSEKPAEEDEEEEPEERPAGYAKVKKLIAVASGKGGVGKSTVAVNLALALAARGKSVGLCDLDIYGPSVPTQLGIAKQRLHAQSVNEIKPIETAGLKVMSIGFMVDPETPVIWRGPMVASMVTQLTHEIQWGELEFMILDMPPGTGDIQLTLTQSVPLSGAIIVTTPGRLALIDACKGLQMFRKVDVPVLGLVENMSYYICPECGHRSEPFNGGGTAEVAERLETPLLAQIPLDDRVQRGGDEGKPIVLVAPDAPQSAEFFKLADLLIAQSESD